MRHRVKKQLFIFDLDGTLADAYTAIEKSLNFTRRRFGLSPVAYKLAKKKVGRGDKQFIQTFFSKEQLPAALAVYRNHHKKALKNYARLKPYAKMLLYLLKRKGKIVAIASNRPFYYTNIIIKKTGIGKYLDYVLCADQIQSHKPKPRILKDILKKFRFKKEQAVYAGDMDVDLETARRAKVDAVFVRGGSSTLKDVKRYRNKKVVSSLRNILTLYD